jgi:hypothetical protein
MFCTTTAQRKHSSFRPASGEADRTSAEGGVVKRGDALAAESLSYGALR